MSDAVLSVILILMVVLPVLPITAALVLGFNFRADSMALRERSVLAWRDAFVATVAAMAAGNRVFGWDLPGGLIAITLSLALILVSVPSAIWLILYWRGKF